MIDMIAKAKVDALTHELVDYLMGETDNIPKEPQYTFKLYRAIGNTGQAVKIAVNIAQAQGFCYVFTQFRFCPSSHLKKH